MAKGGPATVSGNNGSSGNTGGFVRDNKPNKKNQNDFADQEANIYQGNQGGNMRDDDYQRMNSSAPSKKDNIAVRTCKKCFKRFYPMKVANPLTD